MTPHDTDELREQIEEFALHIKPGTTKGKHRTAIFDTLELAKLVEALIQEAENKIVEAYKKGHIDGAIGQFNEQDKEQEKP